MAQLRPASRFMLAALLLLALPLRAQLNPNSAWQKSKTDFLNLYQGSRAQSLKPEILLVIDNSGSTGRLMYHPLFPNNWQDENPPNTENGTDSVSLVISNSSWPTGTVAGGTGTLGSTLKVGFASQYNATTPATTFSATGVTYTLGNSGARGTVTIGSYTYPYNTLIKPNGAEVTADDVATAGGNKSNAVDWMRCASHIRFCLTQVGATTLAVPRYIDFPIPYRPIDATSTISATYRGLTPTLGFDPVANTTNTQIDTDTSTTYPTYDTTTNNNSVCIYGGFNNNGYLNIRTRYLEWAFVGKDPNNGYYCIPNAIPSNSSDKSTQRSINPASITYDGASDTYSWGYMDETATPVDLSKGWVTAFNNKLPSRSRIQAIKEGVIKTWLSYQTQVMFAYRFLNGATLSQTLTGGPGWTYIAAASDLSSVASTSPSGSTPLIESFINAYCQMTNPAAFAGLIGTNAYTASQLACQKHFVIVMTDGAPSSGGEGTCYPYAQSAVVACAGTYAAGTNPTISGNNAVKANNNIIASGGSAWNAATFAAVAAHGGDPGTTATKTWIKDPTTETFGSLATYIPFWVTKRTTGASTSGSGGTVQTFATAHPIQTMTVGVSLGVTFLKSDGTDWTNSYGATNAPTVRTAKKPIQNDTNGSKYRLLAAAYFGDPASTTYDITTAGPFYMPSGASTKPTDAAYFFDGRDPATLVNNLDDAFAQITKIASINATAAPVFPMIGGGLGAEVYIANFLPSGNSGPLWTGDLLMYPTKETSTGTRLIDGSGNLLTGDLNSLNSQWSAADALSLRGWTNRVIYTRLAATSGVSNPGMVRVNLGVNGTDTTNAGYTSIASLLPGSGATKLKNWQFFIGADVGSGTSPLLTRSDSIMGDIINSSPTVLEYTDLPSSITSTVSSVLFNAWQAHKPTNGVGLDTTGHFRMIFVGTNQGFLHAFGEVSWTDGTNPTVPVTKGVVDELWAFAPTDALPYIDQLQISGNSHTFIVDGPPTVYHLDLPQTSLQTSGNGKFDVNGAESERALVIFGLGKGGRSYYAINIEDPAAPSMQWALCPDEPFNYPASRNKSGASATPIANMGLSTCVPTIARVATGRSDISKPNLIVDTVLLGGGYSDTNIEAALPGTPAGPALNTRLGRSAIALEVYSGDILAIWDTSGTSGAGPVATGIVPHELAVGSGLNHRAYFTDINGGLWALGSNARQNIAGNTDFRLDSAKIDDWIQRNVYRQAVTAGAAGNGLISTLPVPFNIPYYPVVRTADPKVAPGAVGIAFVTGDRNNPLDDMTYTAWTKPTQHRINILFDRQDVNSTLAGTDLGDASTGTFSTDSSSTSYFLKTGYGYYINFPAGSTYVPKGIVPPLLIDGALFFSYFNPTASSCAGGTGTTETFRVSNVMRPTVNSTTNQWSWTDASTATAVNGAKSGRIISWSGVASILALRSVLTGVQAGMTGGSGVTLNPSNPQNLVLQDLATQGTSSFAKVRVWRTVH